LLQSGVRPDAATTTILFIDLVGSTDLMQRAGDEMRQLIGAHARLVRAKPAIFRLTG